MRAGLHGYRCGLSLPGIRRWALMLMVSSLPLLTGPLLAEPDRGSESVSATSGHSLPMSVRQQWISAIGNDRVDALWQMLERHAPASLVRLSADNGKNALMVASKKGDLELVKSLVAAGLSVDARTRTQGTAFMFAVLGEQPHVARWLLAYGANPHVVGSNGWTALTLAAAKGHGNLLDWLIEQGVETEVRDVYRYTPFMRAVENGHIRIARRLLDLPETDINARDEYDNTALHHAVAAGNAPMVQLLLAHGASPDIPNRDGASAHSLAAEQPVMQALLQSSGDPDPDPARARAEENQPRSGYTDHGGRTPVSLPDSQAR